MGLLMYSSYAPCFHIAIYMSSLCGFGTATCLGWQCKKSMVHLWQYAGIGCQLASFLGSLGMRLRVNVYVDNFLMLTV